MRNKITHGVGIAAVASLAVSGIVSLGSYFMPNPYKVVQENGVYMIYDTAGNAYISSDTKNLVKFLFEQDPDAVRYAISQIEKEVEKSVQ